MFGIYCGTGDNQINELIPVLCNELNTSPSSISEKEINRGKAQLKASLMMGREKVPLGDVKVLHVSYWFLIA